MLFGAFVSTCIPTCHSSVVSMVAHCCDAVSCLLSPARFVAVDAGASALTLRLPFLTTPSRHVPASPQLCSQTILPAKAERSQAIMDDDVHDKHPIRVCCGHWYHYKCLDEHLTKPPFEKMCLVRGTVHTTECCRQLFYARRALATALPTDRSRTGYCRLVLPCWRARTACAGV